MDAKYSPGPWTTEHDNFGDGPVISIVDATYDLIGVVERERSPGSEGDPEADARLIAAAPAMLELLRDVLELIDSPHLVSSLPGRARALLERIDGGTP